MLSDAAKTPKHGALKPCKFFLVAILFTGTLVVPADSSCPEDHYQCRNPEQCVTFENLCTVDWNFGTISQDASHRCYDQLYCKQGRCSEFECGSQCVPLASVCNGIKECFDGTDEDFCGVSDCQHSMNASKGFFSSFSGQLGRCSVLISAPTNQVIWLLFRQLQTKSLQQLVKVYDGPNAQSRLLLTHSGRLSVSQSLRSTRNFLYVEYPSYSHPNSAFFAFYAAMDAAGDSRSPYIPGCGGYIVDSGMLIGDRRFVGDQCVWYIENRKKNHTILLSNNSPTLLADASYSIVVSDGWSADGAVINPVILSDTTPQLVKSIYSLSDKIRVHFKPDGNFQRLHSWTVSEIASGKCWSNLSEPTGTIKSPNYPSPYDDMSDCRWTIRVQPATMKIRLLLAAVQTEQDHDFIYVYNGASVDSPLLLQKSGQLTLPTVVVSSTNEMLVRFTSNSMTQLSGFLALYSSI